MKHLLIIIAALAAVTVSAESLGAWQNIRFSGRDANSQVLLRTEINQDSLFVNKVIHDPGTGIAEFDLALQNPVTSTYQASIPVGDTRKYLGLRKQRGSQGQELVPVFFPGSALPVQPQLTKLSDDVINDNATNYYDIVADYFTFSDTRFYTAIQNRGGGFPTINGLDVISYMSLIADPTTDPSGPNVTAWALNYMNVGVAGFTPGLYKITGTGISDITRIADITYEIDALTNTLKMSCSISDLLADPDFAAWFNPAEPIIGSQTMIGSTNFLTMNPTTQDLSPGALIHLHPLYADPVPNTAPLMADGAFQIVDGEVFFSSIYQDAEGNFPLTAQIELSDDTLIDLLPQAFDHSVPVPYRTADLAGSLPEYGNGQARVVVSDDNINFYRGDWFPFTYIFGILWPEDVSVQINGGYVVLGWDPVTQTLLGNPVTPDLYRIEASSSPDFSSFDVLGTSSQPGFSYPLAHSEFRSFYRVIAIKYMP